MQWFDSDGYPSILYPHRAGIATANRQALTIGINPGIIGSGKGEGAMMRVLVFSDSHGDTEGMRRALETERPDGMFHLGDGASDLAVIRRRFPELPCWAVRGNCDYRSAAPETLRLTLEGVPVLAVHGHNQRVKFDPRLTTLKYAALEADVRVVLFGHTHRAMLEQELGLYIMNPGSIGLSMPPSYGVLTLDGGNVTMELKNL